MVAKVEAEKKWRKNYYKYIVKHVEASAKDPEKALEAAKAGLAWGHDNFEFVRDGNTMKLAEAMKSIKGTFHTGFVKGEKSKAEKQTVKVPYKGEVLQGDALVAQINKWCDYGTIEPSCRDSMIAVIKNQEDWCDLSDKYFVLLGAGSAMGPFLTLMALGANVIAIDLDRPGIWERLLGVAKASSGTLTFPLSKPEADLQKEGLRPENHAGCNLFTQTPEILTWLLSVQKGKALTVGAYAYLDGALHVQVSLAMDAIIKGLTEGRKDVSVAYLCTPTDCHLIPEEAYSAMNAQFSAMGVLDILVKLTPFFWLGDLKKNARKPVTASDGQTFYAVDGIVNRQGPNYILAKRIQHWRAMVARSQGCTVSSNIAPSTATVSVTSNRLFAMAYGGMWAFKPMEVFEQDTSNAVMGTMLLHDISNKQGTSDPKQPLRNPLELFSFGSFHGGVWRTAYKIDSLGNCSAVIYIFIKTWYILLALVAAVLYFTLF